MPFYNQRNDNDVPLQIYTVTPAAQQKGDTTTKKVMSRFVRNPDPNAETHGSQYRSMGDNGSLINYTRRGNDSSRSLKSAGNWSTRQWKKRQIPRLPANQSMAGVTNNGSFAIDPSSPVNYSKQYVPEKSEDEDEEEEVYIVRQNQGYFAILFSTVQTIILGLMMWQCGIAPVKINPMIGPYPDALSEWGGKNAVNILDDKEWWRLLTPILLHAGIIHLFCNVSVQLDTGAFFEKEWGSVRWLLIYLSSAVGSTALSVIIMPQAVSVGSSGAVMGLFGGKLAEVVMRMCERHETEQEKIGQQVRREQCIAVTCSVTVVMLFSFIPYVDWSAHLGGLIAGFVVGIAIFSCEISSWFFKIFWSLIGLGLSVATFYFTLQYMYSDHVNPPEELRDVCGYYKENFADYQCNCMRAEYMNNNNNNNNNNGGGNGNGGGNRWL